MGRLLLLEFEVVHVPGRSLGIADYLSRHPTELQGASVKAETLWNDWFTVNSVISLKVVLDNNGVTSEQGESVKCAKGNHSVNRINVASEKSQSEGATRAIHGKQVRNIVAKSHVKER